MDALIDTREHPAARAWATVAPCAPAPSGIAVLRARTKSTVIRLDGVGPQGASVVAKHCRSDARRVELQLCEEILPRLPVTALRCYGHLVEDDGSCWLFLEHAGGTRFAPEVEGHRQLVARWLALLHTAAESLPIVPPLPDRGPTHYLAHLHSARRTIERALTELEWRAAERGMLRAVVDEGARVEECWMEVEEACAPMRRTLVHGDLRPKNVHVRYDGGGARLVAMDWETAGWGVPAVDVASLGGPRGELRAVEEYRAIVQARWPETTMRLVLRMLEVGRLFRRLAAIDWCAAKLAYGREKSIAALAVHRAALDAMLVEGGWSDA